MSRKPQWLAALQPNSLVIAACSGGADSLCMTLRLLETPGLRVAIAHVNHGQRGPESDGDEEFVRAFAERHGAPFHFTRVQFVGAVSEDMLREARLKWLKSLARELGAAAVAFGHHGGDAAESLLLAAVRGSGPAGLSGPRAVVKLEDGLLFVRPILAASRAANEEYLRSLQQPWRIDATNADCEPRRNLVRHRIMPLLRELNSHAEVNLAISAHHCAEAIAVEEEYMTRCVVPGVVRCEGGGSIFLDVPALRSFRPETRAALIRHLVRSLPGQATTPLAPRRETLARVQERLEDTAGEKLFNLAPGVGLWLSNHHGLLVRGYDLFEGFELFRAFEPLLTRLPWLVMGADEVVTMTGRREVGGRAASVARQGDPTSVRIATGRVKGTLRFARINAAEHSERLREAGVPGPLRERLGGLHDASGVLWIPGVAMLGRAVPRGAEPTVSVWLENCPGTGLVL